MIRNDLGRLSRALYAAELVDRSTEERAENASLYMLLIDVLRTLASAAGGYDMALRAFELSLLDLLGYRPELGVCAHCGRQVYEEAGGWVASLGGVLCTSCRPPDVPVRPLSGEALTLLRTLQGGERVVASPKSPGTAVELERALREAIHYALDRDVRSAAFLDEVRRRDTREQAVVIDPTTR
jgi:DNA repair protein RecO (recombination protein O)